MRCRQLFCSWQWLDCAVLGVSRWGVLPCWLQLVGRKRALRGRQLLDCGQRHHCIVQFVFCGNVQYEQRIHVSERVFVVPFWCVLLGSLQLVERQRAVWRGQLLDCRQRYKLVMQRLPRWKILPWGYQQL